MKKDLHKSRLIRNFYSLIIFGSFILLIVATGPERKKEHLGNGVIKETTYFGDNAHTQICITGKKERYNRWTGNVVIEQYVYDNRLQFKEEVEMVNGFKNGTAYRTWPNDRVDTVCYRMGEEVPCVPEIDSDYRNAIQTGGNDFTANYILTQKHTYLQNTLNGSGFDDDQIKAYLDTVELLLSNNTFILEEFDQVYSDIMDTLEETHYYDLMQLNSEFSFVKGLDGLKNSEFRMAVIDNYYSEEKSAYSYIEEKYPNYLKLINNESIPSSEFELFCVELDSIMKGYEPPLDPGDPFYADSIDSRLFQALQEIMESESNFKKSLSYRDMKNEKQYFRDITVLFSDNKREFFSPETESGSSAVATVVLSLMLQDFNTADIMKNTVKQSHCIRNKIIQPPSIVLEFSGSDSKNSAVLKGYLIDDGGEDISQTGIVWADIFNPDLSNKKESVSTTNSEFFVTLNDLSEGITYYARAYAINSADTSYSNCIDFIGGSTVGLNPDLSYDLEVKLFPNPARDRLFLEFKSPGEYSLRIADPTGHVLIYKSRVNVDENKGLIELDVNSLKSGVYFVEILDKNENRITRKLQKLR